MQRLSFTNGKNISVNLTEDPFGITEWEGFSGVDMEVQSQTVPFVDGSVFIDAYLENRELAVTLAMQDNGSMRTRYELRRKLISALNPKLGEGMLVYENDFIKKQIKCIPNVPVFENHNSNDSGTPKASLSFIACDPYWEDISPTIVNFSLTEQPTIVNGGDIPVQVKLNISGQCTNVRVSNVSNESQIGLTGLITEPVEISTRFGSKTVTGSEQGWTNIFGGYLHGTASKSGTTVVVGTDGAVLTTKNGISYTSSISGTTGNLYGVSSCFNLNRFVAVGNAGTIISSENGIEWSVSDYSYPHNFLAVASSSIRFVAVGEDGIIVASTDGDNFTPVTSPVSVNLNGVCYDGYQFFAVGDGGTIIKSSDGLAWEAIPDIGISANLNGVTYSDKTGTYVAVGNAGTILVSTDGITWRLKMVGTAANLMSVAYNDFAECFVVVGDEGTMVRSTDDEWVSGTYTDRNLTGVSFIKDLGLCIATGYGLIMRSPDCEEWTPCISMGDTQLHDILYIDSLGLYIAPGNNGNIAVSSDGNVWTNKSIHINIDIYSLAHDPETGAIIGVGTGGSIVRSYDGLTWEKVLDGVEPYTYYLKASADEFLLIDEDETNSSKIVIETSEDAGSLFGITYDSTIGIFIAVGDKGRICTSKNGSIWTERESGTAEPLKSIASSKGVLSVVGEEGTILRSSDGCHWETVDSGTARDLEHVATSPTKARFIAVGDSGTVGTSKDGISWAWFDSGVRAKLNAVCYSEALTQFLAVGDNGTIVTSNDGKDWKGHSSGTGQNYEGVNFFPGLNCYVASGSKGTIMESYTTSTENLIHLLSPNSDINFSLDVGENVLRVACESGNPRVSLEYRQKYIGV